MFPTHRNRKKFLAMYYHEEELGATSFDRQNDFALAVGVLGFVCQSKIDRAENVMASHRQLFEGANAITL